MADAVEVKGAAELSRSLHHAADERPYGFVVLPDSPARLPALSLTVLLR